MAWIIVLGEKGALEWVLQRQQMAFREHVPTEPVRPGDRVAIHSTRGAFGNPTRDESQIVALGNVLSSVKRRSAIVAGVFYPKSCRLVIEHSLPLRHGLPFRPLVKSLTFIRHKNAWPAYLRRTLVPVPEADFDKIAQEFMRLVRRR